MAYHTIGGKSGGGGPGCMPRFAACLAAEILAFLAHRLQAQTPDLICENEEDASITFASQGRRRREEKRHARGGGVQS